MTAHAIDSTNEVPANTTGFAPLSARRIYVMGGIILILVGLILGDVFAALILHPNAGRIGERLLAASSNVASGDRSGVVANFRDIGRALENRGTKVDSHVHIIDFGYLALLLALLQPWVAFGERQKKRLAILFLSGAALLPVGVFLIYYVGLNHSPLPSIGWASIAADFGGLLVIGACAAQLWGLVRGIRLTASATVAGRQDKFLHDRSWSSRMLLAGGTLLILAGFLQGAAYAALDLYRQEDQETSILLSLVDKSAAQQSAEEIVGQYNMLQADKAVKIAAHAHAINFGVLAILLALVQPYVFLSERWRRRWAILLLTGSAVLPVFVLMELHWGLVAGGIADAGGLLVAVALCGMFYGIVRYSGALDKNLDNAVEVG
jgi:heme/copper-type cytochrome/quinol oxidase subunit 4